MMRHDFFMPRHATPGQNRQFASCRSMPHSCRGMPPNSGKNKNPNLPLCSSFETLFFLSQNPNFLPISNHIKTTHSPFKKPHILPFLTLKQLSFHILFEIEVHWKDLLQVGHWRKRCNFEIQVSCGYCVDKCSLLVISIYLDRH